jgi:hypothetical protein
MKVVHIGFPKTGSTFLQKSLFPQFSKDVECIDQDTSSTLFMPVMNYDDTVFDIDRVRERFQRVWKDTRKVLFSSEPLTGLHHQSAFVNRTLIANRLRAIGFDRVIISIRNQYDILESAYKQYIKSGGVLKFDQYISFDTERPGYLYPEYFRYDLIYELYAGDFGKSNVLILQYEDMQQTSYINDLSTFLSVAPIKTEPLDRINPSLSNSKSRILRLINHTTYNSFRPSHLISKRFSTAFFYRQLAKLPFMNDGRSFLGPQARSSVDAFYGESNRALEKSAGIRLSGDYPGSATK